MNSFPAPAVVHVMEWEKKTAAAYVLSFPFLTWTFPPLIDSSSSQRRRRDQEKFCHRHLRGPQKFVVIVN
jgi:hypothetical protein